MILTPEDLRLMRMQQARRDKEELAAFMCTVVVLPVTILIALVLIFLPV